jgi:hypothetical protein
MLIILISDKSEEVIAEDDGDRKRRALLAVKSAENLDKPPITVLTCSDYI